MGVGRRPRDDRGGRHGARHLVPRARAGPHPARLRPGDAARRPRAPRRARPAPRGHGRRRRGRDRPRRRAGLDTRCLPAPARAVAPARRARTSSTSTGSSATCRSSPGRPPGRCIPTRPPGCDRSSRATGSRCRASTSSRACWTTSPRPACASPTRRRVRLGAYLSPGTTVMHEGFVNFNAGTLGASMVEGRISQGVVVGDGSDIGGGASIMGTLSGGGEHRVSIGARTLLGANAGVGHLDRRRLRRRGRPLRHRGHEGACSPTARAGRRHAAESSRARSCRASTASCSAAIR